MVVDISLKAKNGMLRWNENQILVFREKCKINFRKLHESREADSCRFRYDKHSFQLKLSLEYEIEKTIKDATMHYLYHAVLPYFCKFFSKNIIPYVIIR